MGCLGRCPWRVGGALLLFHAGAASVLLQVFSFVTKDIDSKLGILETHIADKGDCETAEKEEGEKERKEEREEREKERKGEGRRREREEGKNNGCLVQSSAWFSRLLGSACVLIKGCASFSPLFVCFMRSAGVETLDAIIVVSFQGRLLAWLSFAWACFGCLRLHFPL